MVGCLLGRLKVEATRRCAHLALDWLRVSAGCISESIAEDTIRG